MRLDRFFPLKAAVLAAGLKTAAVLAASALGLGAVASCSRTTVTADGLDPMVTGALEMVSEDSLSHYVAKLVSFHTRHTLSSKTDPERGIGATVDYIGRMAQQWADASQGRPKPVVTPVSYRVGGPGTRYDRLAEVPEIMVTFPGTEGAREILVVAQIDTRVNDLSDSTSYAPGADDNGSGTAFLMETCRILSQIPLRQTVRCLFVSGEEQGLDGSAYFAKMAKEEGWPVVAVISDDMIGNVKSSETDLVARDRVRVFSASNSGEDSDNRQLARYIKESAGRYVPEHEVVLIYRNDRYMRGGDQQSFLAEGFTAVRISEYYENYYRTHQLVREEDGIGYGDILENVDFPYVAANSKVNLAAILELAQAPARPQGARIANARDLSNYTVLTWNADGGVQGGLDGGVQGGLDGGIQRGPSGVQSGPYTGVAYEILYRETDQPTWRVYHRLTAEEVKAVDGAGISYSIPLSKDNYFFAVRAVSADGHPSLPAFCR